MTERIGSEIQSDTVPVLVHRLHRKGETGRLVLRQGSVTKALHLNRGQITFATSTDRDDRLVQTLLKRGIVSLPDLMTCLDTALKEHKRHGEVLRARKKITEEDLDRALQEQLKDIVFSVFAWTEGSWELEKTAAAAEEISIKAHPLELILEGVRRIPSWARVYEVVGGLSTEYRSTKEADDLAERARLMPGERQILTLCQETRTLSEICDSLPMNDFVLCKVVWGLLIVGALMKA
ncbi:MAG TPA: DUF4388 domain-containing protein [Candidatus Polarisedimenticolia bacterium]|jgi:hypothetical protein|nr:DUF4388 domain-containing protein [Candidatus Polarisedimenticolia bacterium]